MRIILGSGSPRRRELLERLGIDFEVRTLPGVDESFPSSLPAAEVPLYIARKKAEAYRQTMAEDELIITADTIVSLCGKVIGKPHSPAQAEEMLELLSGHEHEVVTGVTLSTRKSVRAFSAVSTVRFARLTSEEIKRYVATCRPLDKAGAYGIQEWIGLVGVEEIRGSFFNVMGLPVQRVYVALRDIFEGELHQDLPICPKR